MSNDLTQELKISYPKWVAVPFILGWTVLLLAFFFYLAKFARNGPHFLLILKIAFLLILLFSGIWVFLKFLFYSVIASKRGLETDNLFGKRKSFLWHEIIGVRRPRLGIPQEIAYVVSKEKEKLLLLRSMKNYSQLITLIKEKASNLQGCDL
jgi:hypothetical protein